MTDSMPTLVLAGKLRSDLPVTELEPVTSERTGKLLRHLELNVRIRDRELNDQFHAELRSSAAGIDDASGGSWRVRSYRYGYTDAISSFEYTVELLENEQLNLTELVIESLSLVPERWSLDEDGVLAVLVTLDPAQRDHLERLLAEERDQADARFPVRQVDIREEPVLMRFGRCYWQHLEDGRTRHLIHLMTERPEGDSRSSFSLMLHPEVARLQDAAIIQGRKLDALIAELRDAGVLSEDAVARIRESGASAPSAAYREFDRAGDVEAFFHD